MCGDVPSSPGPITIASGQLESMSRQLSERQVFTVANGAAICSGNADCASTSARTIPAPLACAPRAARMTAPAMPASPPMIATRPRVPLYAFAGTAGSQSSTFSEVTSRGVSTSASTSPIFSTTNSPTRSRRNSWPRFTLPNVNVIAAGTAPVSAPVVASSPVGRSIATTAQWPPARARIALIASATSARGVPADPVPSSASSMTASCPVGIANGPSRSASILARLASSVRGSPLACTVIVQPRSRNRPAINQPSPPLLPVPTKTAALRHSRACSHSAAACAARCINTNDDGSVAIVRASSSRAPSAVTTAMRVTLTVFGWRLEKFSRGDAGARGCH